MLYVHFCLTVLPSLNKDIILFNFSKYPKNHSTYMMLCCLCFCLQGEDPDLSERALDGLKQVMIVKSRVVLPYLVPQVR